jgi:hypothetical protein
MQVLIVLNFCKPPLLQLARILTLSGDERVCVRMLSRSMDQKRQEPTWARAKPAKFASIIVEANAFTGW